MTHGAPLMVWQDGETVVANQDLLRLRLEIVSDNLFHKKLIPPMAHLLLSLGNGAEAQGTRMRSIEYDTVSDRYGKYLLEEVLNVGRYHTTQFSRVLSHIGSYTALQWHPEKGMTAVTSSRPK
jgi:hypothetical protein